MILFRRCQYPHVRLVKPQASQAEDAEYHISQMEEMVADSIALSAWRSERCIAVSGIYPINPMRGLAWALLSDEACGYLLPIMRAMRRVIDHYPAPRVEMTVEAGFAQGHRMAELLGFHCETPTSMPYFYPNGHGAFLYARIRP